MECYSSSVGQAVDRVCLAHGPDYESSATVFEDATAGPERFFYDKTTYTGGTATSALERSHKKNGVDDGRCVCRFWRLSSSDSGLVGPRII